nr:LOW QUALITY PROTEIN: inactive pancreatic lipase-related protein 1-like [Pseudochaenichthys georgianus]
MCVPHLCVSHCCVAHRQLAAVYKELTSGLRAFWSGLKEIKANESNQVLNYSGTRKTRFIIPGYLKEGDEDWPQEMCKAMLTWENVNCVAVEWKKGVRTQYVQAANNARVVSAQVASMITFLKSQYKQQADKFHIIGHSLGAHAAGAAGSRIPGLARITGTLDPVEPYFQDTDESVRLDTSDATFVDVIHTDGLPFNSKLGLGMSQSIGHIDFYPNGGELMPGCTANKGWIKDLDAIWQGTKRFDDCNHVRSYEYYIESMVKSQGFVAFPCSDKDSFDDRLVGVGRTYEVLLDAEVDVGVVEEVTFRWNNHIFNPMKPRYGVSKMELQRGKDNMIVSFCGTENVKENAVQRVLRCQA